jgi:hypothetical protein
MALACRPSPLARHTTIDDRHAGLDRRNRSTSVRSTLPALFALVGCLACSTGPDDDAPPAVEVTVLSVDLDAHVLIGTMRNVGGKTLTFGDCSGGLETGASGEWVWIPREGACDMWGGWLDPGKTAEFDVPLPAEMPDCPLRVSVALDVGELHDQRVTGHSGTFCPPAD